MELSSELEACLREFAAAGPADLLENGARIAPLSSLSWEVRGKSEKPLLHLWSENHNLTRRVLAITDHSEQRLALAVECFGRSKPDRLEFLRIEFDRSARELSREQFAQSVRALCAHEFPDETLEFITSSADLEHSLSGNYARGVLRRGTESWGLFAVPDDESDNDPARCLTFALLWLDHLQKRSARKPIAGIRILLPAMAAAKVAHLLPALRPELRLQLFERHVVMERLQRVEPSEVANFTSCIVPVRETQLLLDRARQKLSALLPSSTTAISFHPNISSKEVVVRFRGLACIRWQESGIHFDGPDLKARRVSGSGKEDARELFRELEMYRHPLASKSRHPLFRAQAERWLEFLVRQDVSRIDSSLDPRFEYAQVLASTAGEHGILDVLSVTRSGRLAILELKTVEHPVFLLQSAKYWLRINRHLEQGDFPRYGYFPDIVLQPAPPIVYLVAPALRFHPATEILLRYLNPRIEVVRVGLAESWRRGLSVVLRQ
jgi:hypothetical protein